MEFHKRHDFDNTSFEVFNELLDNFTTYSMEKLYAQSAILIETDGSTYVQQLVYTSLRSLLTPFLLLTEWFNKTTEDRILVSLKYMCDMIISKIIDDSLIPDLKKISINSLVNRNIEIYKYFYSGSLIKVIKHFKWGLTTSPTSRLKGEHFFYSLVNFKAGLSRLPNKYVLENVKSSINDLKVESGILKPNSVQFLRLSVRILFNNLQRGTAILPTSFKLSEGSTYEYRHSEAKFNFLSENRGLSVKEREENFKLRYRNFKFSPEINKARVAILDEPLKNRFLTINSESFQIGTRDLQTDLLKRWKSLPFGTMTENSLDAAELELTNLFPLKEEDQRFYYSVDYSAATDKLKSSVTHTLIKEVLSYYNISENEREYYIAALSAKTIRLSNSIVVSNFPSKKLNKAIRALGKFKQTNGQMMGNTLSFPLLCLANLATFLYAQFGHDRTFLRYLNDNDERIWGNYDLLNLRCGAIINGDDAVARLSAMQMELQRSLASDLGFVTNVNKSIISVDRFNINSRMFLLEGKSDDRHIREVGYLNQRVLYNWNVKKTVKEEESNSPSSTKKQRVWSQHVQLYNKMLHLNQFLNNAEVKDRCAMYFLYTHSSKLPSYPLCFLAPSVGGYGMVDHFNVMPQRVSRDTLRDIGNNMLSIINPSIGHSLMDDIEFHTRFKIQHSFQKKGLQEDYFFYIFSKEHSEIIGLYSKLIAAHGVTEGWLELSVLPTDISLGYDVFIGMLISYLSQEFRLFDLSTEIDMLYNLFVTTKFSLGSDMRRNLVANLATINYDQHFMSGLAGWHVTIHNPMSFPFASLIVKNILKNF